MKKRSLRFAAVAVLSGICANVMAQTVEKGELPLDQTITINKDEVYTFTPTSDGILSIEFNTRYPSDGILQSDLYSADINPEMDMIPMTPINAGGAYGATSPALYEIKYMQPLPDSDAKVRYLIVGPNDVDILNPSNNITTMQIKATFTEAGEGNAYELSSVTPEPGGVFDFNTVGNLVLAFTPVTQDITCSGISIAMFEGETPVKTIQGSDREISWGYAVGLGGYFLNLTNLWDYELKGTDIDSFTITLSGFNKEISGDYVNEDGNIVLTYQVDEFYGIIRLDEVVTWPTCIFPEGAYPGMARLKYEGALNPNVKGDVIVLGADLAEITSQPSDKTFVYEPQVTISDNEIEINFDNFKQTGPVDDGGNINMTNGYRTSGGIMSVIIRNFLGADGSQVQPVLMKISWQAQAPEESGVDSVNGRNNVIVQVYNLSGVKVAETVSQEAANLPPGIYIINGKKVCIQ